MHESKQRLGVYTGEPKKAGPLARDLWSWPRVHLPRPMHEESPRRPNIVATDGARPRRRNASAPPLENKVKQRLPGGPRSRTLRPGTLRVDSVRRRTVRCRRVRRDHCRRAMEAQSEL
ncbi:hypothetical protein MTO96_024469 [Rhipicephalus appendiculatus]